MSVVTVSPGAQAAALLRSSMKYKVPLDAMLAIYGQESDFGRNSSTSTAGAVGPFQFIPSTARQYNYPLTNTPNTQQFEQQADAFGRYLKDNNPSGDPNGWAPAMRGGYTQAQANSTLVNIPPALKQSLSSFHAVGGLDPTSSALQSALGAVPGLGGAQAVTGVAKNLGVSIPNPLNALEEFFSSFLKRAVFIFLGIILLAIGVYRLAKS